MVGVEAHAAGRAADRALEIAMARPPGAGRTRVVGVDGPSGAGKTTLAKVLLERAEQRRGEVPALVRMDQIYPGWDGLADAVGLLVRQVLEPLAHGAPAVYRTWDWAGMRWNGRVEVPPAELLVIEGVGSGARSARRYLSALVWVEAPTAVRAARAIARDGEAYRPHWERWAAQESALFAAEDIRSRADVVLATA